MKPNKDELKRLRELREELRAKWLAAVTLGDWDAANVHIRELNNCVLMQVQAGEWDEEERI